MRVAAIVPHWNRRDLLETLFASLKAQTRPFDEVVVVDNGSTDDSVALATGFGARVIPFDRNLGFAAAVNRGIRACETDWVAILNNDVTLAPDWLATLLSASDRDSSAWFLTGKLLRADDRSRLDGAYDEISRGACASRCGSGVADSPRWNEQRTIRFAPMTAALFRRSLFEKAGYLDEDFRSYLEDVDFGLRCALAGCSGLYVPSATAQHRGSATLGRWNSDTVRAISRNQVLLAAKYFRGQSLYPIVAGQLLWGLVALRHWRGVSFVLGKFAGLRDARGIKRLTIKNQQLRAVVEASEREIFEVERQTGFSWYWRAYFWLLWR